MPWIVQGNPKSFDMRSYLCQPFIYWLVNRYVDEMRLGDQVLLWEAGPVCGVVGYGVVTELPVARSRVRRPEALGDDFWRSAVPEAECIVVGMRVLASVERGLFVARQTMKQQPALLELDILRMPQATVFRCSGEQLAAVVEFPSERYTDL